MIAPATRPTARIASELNRKTSIAPSRPPTNTSTLDRLIGSLGVQGLAQALFDLVEVGGEQQEGSQAGRSHRVALGQGLGGVADRVEGVGDLAGLAGAPEISVMPPALSVIGPKVSIAST